MGIFWFVWRQACQLYYIKREEALQRHQHILRKYQYASSEDKNPFCVVHPLI